jgi:hypothetical protein
MDMHNPMSEKHVCQNTWRDSYAIRLPFSTDRDSIHRNELGTWWGQGVSPRNPTTTQPVGVHLTRISVPLCCYCKLLIHLFVTRGSHAPTEPYCDVCSHTVSRSVAKLFCGAQTNYSRCCSCYDSQEFATRQLQPGNFIGSSLARNLFPSFSQSSTSECHVSFQNREVKGRCRNTRNC